MEEDLHENLQENTQRQHHRRDIGDHGDADGDDVALRENRSSRKKSSSTFLRSIAAAAGRQLSRGDRQSFPGMVWTQTDLNRKQKAISSLGLQLEQAAHEPPLGLMSIAKPMPSMDISIRRGNEGIDVQGEKLLTAVAEHLLGGNVDQQDVSCCIDLQNRFRDRFQYIAKVRAEFGPVGRGLVAAHENDPPA
jgi:hypothetical protein